MNIHYPKDRNHLTPNQKNNLGFSLAQGLLDTIVGDELMT